MRSEDDTFRALQRPAIEEMLEHYVVWVKNNNYTQESIDTLCKRHGWTWQDFKKEAGSLLDNRYDRR